MSKREDYYIASDKIHHRMTDVLKKWVDNEKSNLDSFIASPEDHVLYNPYIKPDWEAMRARSEELGVVSRFLGYMSSYKKQEGATRTQYEYGLDRIPHILFQRLYDWIEGKYADMVRTAESQTVSTPVDEYQTLVSFDIESYAETMNMYRESLEGLEAIIQYKKDLEEQQKKEEEIDSGEGE